MIVRPVDDTLLDQLRHRVSRRAAEWRPGTEVQDFSPLKGGTSSLTFVVQLEVEGQQIQAVLKVAPPGLEPVRNRDVLRQARLQKALQRPGRPLAPDVLFSDPGEPPEVPPFMAMSFVPGECREPTLSDVALPAELVRARFADAVQVLAALHAVVPSEIELGDEPAVELSAEVERWTRAFATLPADLQGDYERAAELLRATVPAALPPVVNHGDFRLGNTLCENERVNAVIDWEIWSVGDPRIDLAWMAYFVDDAGHPAVAPGWVAGTPARDELVSAYEQATGRAVPELDWFHALTRYKEAGLTGLLLKRAAKLNEPLIGSMSRMRPALPRLVQEAISIVGG
jgi:aminoglycoside phosphotransferase (APT) family kinase protein